MIEKRQEMILPASVCGVLAGPALIPFFSVASGSLAPTYLVQVQLLFKELVTSKEV